MLTFMNTIDDRKKLSVILKDCVRIVDAEVRKNETLEQIQQAKVLAKYGALGGSFVKTDNFVETIFKELTGQQNAYMPH